MSEGLLNLNVNDLRKRLHQTERDLKSLQALEPKFIANAGSSARKTGSYNSRHHGERAASRTEQSSALSSPRRMNSLRLEDLSPGPTYEDPRESTEGEEHAHPEVHRERRDSGGSASSMPLGAAFSDYPNYRRFGGSGPLNSTPTRGAMPALGPGAQPLGGTGMGVMDYENETLRKRLHLLREENGQLLRQNHQLLSQLESTSYQLHQADARIQQANLEIRDYEARVPHLDDQLARLEAENEAQEAALRNTEERLESCEHQFSESQEKTGRLKEELKALKAELSHEVKVRKRAESERNAALQSVEDLQDSLAEYQHRSRGKLKEFQSAEEHLRDNLVHADREREELLETNSALQGQMEQLQEELRQCQQEKLMEREMRTELDQMCRDLRTQLASQTQAMGKLEGQMEHFEGLRTKNRELQAKFEQHRQALENSQQETSQVHAQLERLIELSQSLENRKQTSKHGSDSGVSVSKPPDDIEAPSDDLDGSYLESLNAATTSPGSRAVVAELCLSLALRDQEIQELRALVDRRTARHSPASSVESLKKELQTAIERQQESESRTQELETILCRLEDERSKHTTRILQLEEKLSDLEVQNTSLETRLSQRNNQLTGQQRDLNEKLNELGVLEREVRKKSSQISSLERELDGKMQEVTEVVDQLEELEKELSDRANQLQRTRSELEDSRRQTKQNTDMLIQLKQLHSEQVKELEGQIDILSRRCEDRADQLEEATQTNQELRQQLEDRQQSVSQLRKELSFRVEQNEGALVSLEQQAMAGTERVRQLESALAVCREELKVALEQMEETKTRHDRDIAQRDEEIETLQLQLRRTRSVSEERETQLGELAKSLEDRQASLQRSVGRVAELEEGQTRLESMVSRMEQELTVQQERLKSERTDLEKKLEQACQELEQRTSQVHEMTTTIRDLASEKQQFASEINELERQVHLERKEADKREEELVTQETNLRDLRNQLKQKEERVQDLEDQIDKGQDDQEEKVSRINELDLELRKAQGEVHQTLGQLQESQRQLEEARAQVVSRDQQLSALKQSLRCSQDDLRSRSRELDDLDSALKDRQWELQQRAAQVTQLDMAIKEHRSEMEQKLILLEGALKKSQFEAQLGKRQVSDLETRLSGVQGELVVSRQQQQAAEQTYRTQQRELDARNEQLLDLEQQLSMIKRQGDESREENLDLRQELRLAREQQQKVQLELTEASHDLSITQRDQERLAREVDNINAFAQEKESEVASLSEELGAARAREAQLESRAGADIRRLQREMDQLREQHRTEVKQIEEKYVKIVSGKEEAGANFRLKIKRASEHEQQMQRDLDLSQAQVVSLEAELTAARDIVQTSNHTIALKESQISRLEARLATHPKRSVSMATDVSDQDQFTETFSEEPSIVSENTQSTAASQLRSTLTSLNRKERNERTMAVSSNLSRNTKNTSTGSNHSSKSNTSNKGAANVSNNMRKNSQDNSLKTSSTSQVIQLGVPKHPKASGQGKVAKFEHFKMAMTVKGGIDNGTAKPDISSVTSGTCEGDMADDVSVLLQPNTDDPDSLQGMLKEVSKMYCPVPVPCRLQATSATHDFITSSPHQVKSHVTDSSINNPGPGPIPGSEPDTGAQSAPVQQSVTVRSVLQPFGDEISSMFPSNQSQLTSIYSAETTGVSDGHLEGTGDPADELLLPPMDILDQLHLDDDSSPAPDLESMEDLGIVTNNDQRQRLLRQMRSATPEESDQKNASPR